MQLSWDPHSDIVGAYLAGLADPHPEPFLQHAAAIVAEGHRVGVLRGIGGDGNRVPDVTYRKGKLTRARFRTGRNQGVTKGEFKGVSLATMLPHNNLSPAEYRKLTGPPLAPRGEESRILSNFRIGYGQLTDGRWSVVAELHDVLNAKGRPFMEAHFEGRGRLKRRDFRGIRPADTDRIRAALAEWVRFWVAGGR